MWSREFSSSLYDFLPLKKVLKINILKILET